MNCYSLDLRKKALEHHKKSHSIRKTAKEFAISPSTLCSWIAMNRDQGSPKMIPPKPRESKLVPTLDLIAFVKENPIATLKQIAERFKCSIAYAHKRLQQVGISHKKMEPAFIERDEIKRKKYQKKNRENPR